MRLIGSNVSPFARQVAIWLTLQGRAFDRLPLSTSADAERLRTFHPAGRVPVLMLNDGTRLIETSAICDWLDETAPTRMLVPGEGRDRRDCLQRMACATLASEKLVALFRAKNSGADAMQLTRLREQISAGFAMLREMVPGGDFLGGEQPDGSDIALVCAWQMAAFMGENADALPLLSNIVSRANAIPAFALTNPNQKTG